MSRKHPQPPRKGLTPPKRNQDLIPDAWNDLNGLHTQCVSYLTASTSVHALLQNAEATAKVADRAALATNAALLNKDAKAFAERLESIHAQHAQRVGGISDPQEMMQAIQIGESYADWTQSFESVVFPSVRAIHELYRGVEGVDVPEAIALDPTIDSASTEK